MPLLLLPLLIIIERITYFAFITLIEYADAIIFAIIFLLLPLHIAAAFIIAIIYFAITLRFTLPDALDTCCLAVLLPMRCHAAPHEDADVIFDADYCHLLRCLYATLMLRVHVTPPAAMLMPLCFRCRAERADGDADAIDMRYAMPLRWCFCHADMPILRFRHCCRCWCHYAPLMPPCCFAYDVADIMRHYATFAAAIDYFRDYMLDYFIDMLLAHIYYAYTSHWCRVTITLFCRCHYCLFSLLLICTWRWCYWCHWYCRLRLRYVYAWCHYFIEPHYYKHAAAANMIITLSCHCCFTYYDILRRYYHTRALRRHCWCCLTLLILMLRPYAMLSYTLRLRGDAALIFDADIDTLLIQLID